jgi:hypothetical protein
MRRSRRTEARRPLEPVVDVATPIADGSLGFGVW